MTDMCCCPNSLLLADWSSLCYNISDTYFIKTQLILGIYWIYYGNVQDTYFLWNSLSPRVYLVSKQGKGGVMLGDEKEMSRCHKQEIHFEM